MKTNAINSFKGEYRFLSNYWPVQVEFDGITYPSVEQAYKAAKTADQNARRRIAEFEPNKKVLQRQIEGVLAQVEIRKDWTDEERLRVMRFLLNQKFDSRDTELRQKLIDTGNSELIEGNDWGDRFFGVCDGVGENHLGRLLMEVRAGISTFF